MSSNVFKGTGLFSQALINPRSIFSRLNSKRPVPLKTLEDMCFDIEKELRNQGVSEVKSELVGEMVMDRLAKIDEVSYVRFASVYRQFKDINVFIDELKDLIKKER